MPVERNGWSETAVRDAAPGWVPEARFLAETDSTNSDALAWAARGAPDGAIVVADFQRDGQGRLGRSWFAPPGKSLLLTVILRPRLDPQALALINLAGAVAVCDAVREEGIEASIKWPNDVIAGDRKLAGILSEHRFDAVCLGVGINVNVESFPGEIAAVATSLFIEAGRPIGRGAILRRFLDRFEPLYRGLPGSVPEPFRRRCSTLGRRVRVNLPQTTLEGTAIDIDPTGALILDTVDVVSAGDVVHVRHREGTS